MQNFRWWLPAIPKFAKAAVILSILIVGGNAFLTSLGHSRSSWVLAVLLAFYVVGEVVESWRDFFAYLDTKP